MSIKNKLAFLKPDLEAAKGVVYLKFIPYYSKEGIKDFNPVHHGLFDETPEQISHGIAPWDEYGWSRDGWSV